MPIYFKGYFSEAESEFFAMAGPKFNFLISQNISHAPQPYTEEGVGEINGKASSFNFAVGLGVGFSLKRQLEITGRYDFALSNTYKVLMSKEGADPNTSSFPLLGIAYIWI